jgi:PAS domain S-box-containing protein
MNAPLPSAVTVPLRAPSPSILIVEDERITARDLQQKLVELGYDAFAIAGSADEAIARAGERSPDLVLMDIRIDGPLDGVQAGVILKEKFDTAIVYLTAHADRETLARAKQIEPHGYLLKPVQDAVLLSTLEIALYRHNQERLRTQAADLGAQGQAELLRMSRALRERDENFRMMVSAVKDYAIFMLDAEGRVANWNEGAARLKGYREKEILGKHLSAFYTAADIAGGEPERHLAYAERFGRIEDEGWRVRKDGSLFLAAVVLAALRDSTGELRGFAKVTRDVTAQRESETLLRETVQRFSVASRAAGFGFWDSDL